MAIDGVAAMKACIILLEDKFRSEFIIKWFDIPREELNLRTPLESLMEGKMEEVLDLAVQDVELPKTYMEAEGRD